MKGMNHSVRLLLGFIAVILSFIGMVYSAQAQTVYFFDDFESGLGKWEVSGNDWGLTQAAYRSLGHSVTDSPKGNYSDYSNASITLAQPIDLSAATSPLLTFWHKYSIHNSWGTDYVYVDISQDRGLTWTNVVAYTGYLSSWDYVTIDLTPYKDQLLLLRFRISSNSAYVADGWYIDDVEIKEMDRGILTFPFSDNFENGLCNWVVSGNEWDLTEMTSRSATHSVTDSPSSDAIENYSNYSNASMSLAYPIDLSGTTSPVLTFWHKHAIHNSWGTDYAYVDISRDRGLSWETPIASYTGYLSTWDQVMIDFSSYKDESLLLRFRISSNSAYVADGWSIDDVEFKELGQKLYFCDSDKDGYRSSQPAGSCAGTNCAPAGCQIAAGNDCNDDDADIHPGAAEICGDDIDNNCNCSVDEECRDDAIMSFGEGSGIWIWGNNSTWKKLHAKNPDSLVTGDLDGNGKDDIIVDFGPAHGIWVRYNNALWKKLHGKSPESMVTGDIDGNGRDEIIIDFGTADGIWIRYNNTAWKKLHGESPDSMVAGDIDGNGRDDIIIDFGTSSGIWVRYNDGIWKKLHAKSPDTMVTGDLDGTGKDDIIIDFGTADGIWLRLNDEKWEKLYSLSPEGMVTGDIDGNGRDDVIIDFGPVEGIRIRYDNGTWTNLHAKSPDAMVIGDMDRSGQDDILIDFGPGTGIWVRYNNAAWKRLHSRSCDLMTAGDIDGI